MTDILPLPPDHLLPEQRLTAREKALVTWMSGARQRRRRRRVAALTLTGALILGVGGGTVYAHLTATPHVIESSYAFDVTNRALLAGYADNVYVGRVEKRVDTQVDRQRTLFRITVEQVYKGSPGHVTVVRQLGYSSLRGTWIPGDQPVLQEGKRYLLATTNADHRQQTVIAGPEAVVTVTSTNKQKLDMKWSTAVREQKYPLGVPR